MYPLACYSLIGAVIVALMACSAIAVPLEESNWHLQLERRHHIPEGSQSIHVSIRKAIHDYPHIELEVRDDMHMNFDGPSQQVPLARSGA
jgi:hypothetical protein